MRAAKDFVGHDVIEDGSERLIGNVTDVLFDDDCRRVLAFLARDRLHGGWYAIAFEDVRAFRERAILVRLTLEGLAAASAAAQAASRGSLQGTPVVCVQRRYLGTLNDIYFDQRSGHIVRYEVYVWDPGRTSLKPRLFGVERSHLINGVLVVSAGRRDQAAGRAH
jgi:uncharacterized protein YrrD